MDLRRRLARLEHIAAPPPPRACAGCGLDLPERRGTGPAEVVVGWWSAGDPAPKPCTACGRKRELRIEFDKAG